MNSHLCPFCGKLNSGLSLETHRDQDTLYSLYECAQCKVQWWDPLKNPGSAWYEHDERYAGANKNPPREPNWNHRKTISYLAGKEGRVLDVGCGTGNFLAHAQKSGWEVHGIDFDRNAIHSAQDVFKLPNIEEGSLYDFVTRHPEERSSFSLVTFFDVFEHLDDHHVFAQTVRELLSPGGYVAMSMPCRDGARWLQPNDLPPRHLTRWDRTSLRTFWEREGFAVRYMKRLPAPFFYIVMKFRFRYGARFSVGLVAKAQKEKATSEAGTRKFSFRVKLLHLLAITKDLLLFGIPAGVVWMVLLFLPKRYTGLYTIAEKL